MNQPSYFFCITFYGYFIKLKYIICGAENADMFLAIKIAPPRFQDSDTLLTDDRKGGHEAVR